MGGNKVREKYLKFFEERGHKIIPPAPLVLKNDPTTLFTSAGMQPLVSYLMGEKYPGGYKRLADSQPSFRSQDIEEVGDNRHTTFFEMLGNWSLGDYFKKEQIPWFWEFITKELNLKKEKLYVSVFEGANGVPKDEESAKLWEKVGVAKNHIFYYGFKKNWWSRAGTPDQMPVGEIGGPSSEVFYEFDQIKHDKKFGKVCHPNCDCGRFLEIGNQVFMQYKKTEKGLEKLPKNNVDFGGGLERLTAAINNDPDIFKTDLFWPVIEEIEKLTKKQYSENKNEMRIIADHIKASTFLLAEGLLPGNKLQGYLLRRLIRRSTLKLWQLNESSPQIGMELSKKVMEIYPIYFKNVQDKQIETNLASEMHKFLSKLSVGLKKLEKTDPSIINEQFAFDLMQSEGFPFE